MEPFIGEIKMVGFNFAPVGWAFCNGQLVSIAEYEALFTLLGTTYGGDGMQTFGLPDLRGRIPMHWGNGPGLSGHVIGEISGTETVSLTSDQMPRHLHSIITFQTGNNAVDAPGTSPSPINHFAARISNGSDLLAYAAQSDGSAGDYAATTTSDAQGGSQAHDNVSPFQCATFIIALEGIYPSHG